MTVTETTSDAAGRPLRVDEARLRFLSLDELTRVLHDAGFAVAAQYGDWSMTPVGDDSPEIITIARTPPDDRPDR